MIDWPVKGLAHDLDGATARSQGLVDTEFLQRPDSSGRSQKRGEVALDQFRWRDLDNSADSLRETAELRYMAYCVERSFLDSTQYPDGIEWDEFDARAFHVGIFHGSTGLMTATARIVGADDEGLLPLHQHCVVDGKYQAFLQDVHNVGEISRFVMSRAALDGICAASASAQGPDGGSKPVSKQELCLPAILTLYKSIYQTARRNGIPVLVAAMEQTLRRLVNRFHFPFRQIGPEVDYFGPVAPFMLDLDELDDVLFDEAPWLLAEFYRGLDGKQLQTVWDVGLNDKVASFSPETTREQSDAAVAAYEDAAA